MIESEYTKFQRGDVVKLNEAMQPAEVRYLEEDKPRKIEAGNTGVVVRWDAHNSIAVVELQRPRGRYFEVEMSDSFITLYHRFRSGDTVTLLRGANLADAGYRMGEMLDSRGEEPDCALPGARSGGTMLFPSARAHVAFALPSRDRSGHKVELFMSIYPLHLDCSARNTEPSLCQEIHIDDDEFNRVMSSMI